MVGKMKALDDMQKVQEPRNKQIGLISGAGKVSVTVAGI